MINTAILIDGGFFLKRYPKVIKNGREHSPEEVADNLMKYAGKHISKDCSLYRILYYDSSPLDKRVHNPISQKSVIFNKTPEFKFRNEFFDQLKRRRKVALRLGILKSTDWQIRPLKLKQLLKGEIKVEELTESDIFYQMSQKRVDMKIGLDIASLALRNTVDRIVLISGDSDFVPAAKMARREGIDFILDPMWNNIDPNLFEHIDGLHSTFPKPEKATAKKAVKPVQKDQNEKD